MFKHEYHNLLFHDDDELADLVGAPLEERVTIHEWPLSSVERITTEEGRRLIYKSQCGPTVEPEFYARARSSLLPWATTLYRTESHSCMLIECLDAPRLQDVTLKGDDAERVALAVLAEIADVEGDLPYILDVSDEGKWLAFVESTLRELQGLVDDGKLKQVTRESVRMLDRSARLPQVIEAVSINPGLMHGDLGRDHVFICDGGYKIIDWQRPIYGPRGLEAAEFLQGFGLDATKYARPVPAVGDFLLINWCTQCQARWIPDVDYEDRYIAPTAEKLKQLIGP